MFYLLPVWSFKGCNRVKFSTFADMELHLVYQMNFVLDVIQRVNFM